MNKAELLNVAMKYLEFAQRDARLGKEELMAVHVDQALRILKEVTVDRPGK